MLALARYDALATAAQLAVIVCAGACAHEPVPAAASATEQRASTPANAEPRSARMLRSLGEHATFADLVRIARTLGASSDGSADDGTCLLLRDGEEHVLAADLMPALERAPDPPASLAAQLGSERSAIALLTAWGVLGAPDAPLVAAGLTTTSPPAPNAAHALLALTESGLYLRHTTPALDALDAASAPMTQDAALARIDSELRAPGATLYVTAEATTPVDRLYQVLAALPPQLEVALAVILPAGTTLPPSASESRVTPCPNGLPEPPPDAAFGELDRSALEPLIATLQDGASRCVARMRTGSTRIKLALRIGPAGLVEHACLIEQGSLDAAAARCMLDLALRARANAGAQAGLVDVHVPLALEPVAPVRQRAACER